MDVPLPSLSEIASSIRYFQFSARDNNGNQALVVGTTQLVACIKDTFFFTNGLTVTGDPQATLRLEDCLEFSLGGGILDVWMEKTPCCS